MDASYFIPNETDAFLISQYKDFLPKKIFDAHMHLELPQFIWTAQKSALSRK